MHKLIIFILIIFLLAGTAQATEIDFKERYQDYDNNTYLYTNQNLDTHPLYIITENENNYNISRQGISVTLPKRTWISYNFYPDRIQQIITIQNYSQINQLVTKINSTVWYLTVPWSSSQVKSVTDDLIDMGVFQRSIKLSVSDNNLTCGESCPVYQVVPKVVGGDIRIYFNPLTYSGVVYPLVITENTITVTNSTTQGWSTSNISLNGSRWTNDGSLAINLRNDSSLNMSGLVGYWSFDETQGTVIHNVNTEVGTINSTNQGTWNGNATLNYTSGVIGNAGKFDGVNDYINVGNDNSLNTTENFTYSVRVRNDSTIAIAVILSKTSNATGGSGGTQLYFRPTSPYIRFGVGNTTHSSVISSNTFQPNNIFYNIVITRNNTFLKMYINGIQESSFNNPRFMFAAEDNMNFGRNSATLTNYLNGSIDEVQIWDRDLNATEVAILHNTSLRIQAMPVIANISANTNYTINRTRIVYSGQDSKNNASIYSRQNNTVAWEIVQENATSDTWYTVLNNYSSMDFGVMLQGNGSNTVFFTSLEYDETPMIFPPNITGWSNSNSSNSTLTLTVQQYTNITFNATANQTLTSCSWTGATQVNCSADTYAYRNFTTLGVQQVIVSGSNANGSTQTITWTITVNGTTATYLLEGWVDNILGVKLENARIDFNGSYMFTDANGYYNFTNASNGTYTILARAIGYNNATNTTAIESDAVVNFTLTAGYTDAEINARIEEAQGTGIAYGVLGGLIGVLALRKRIRRNGKGKL